jgi:coenzyme F420-reducing hydrogenase alpha subunit
VVEELKRAREFAIEAVSFTASLPCPDFEEDFVFLALRDADVYAAGVGFAWAEAPRGLLGHRYAIDDDGTILEARIVPPTSQNQGRMEQSLHGFVQQHVELTSMPIARTQLPAAQPRPRPPWARRGHSDTAISRP